MNKIVAAFHFQGGTMTVDALTMLIIFVDHICWSYLLIVIVMQISDVKTLQASTAITAVMTLLSEMADGKYTY